MNLTRPIVDPLGRESPAGRTEHVPGVYLPGSTRDAHRVAHVLFGERRVLAQLGKLRGLFYASGQASEWAQIPLSLATSRARSKQPVLLTFANPDGSPYAAVFLYQYRAGFLPTRIFVSLDFAGQRTVIAPPSLRPEIAHAVTRHLLHRGALLALVSVKDADFENAPAAAGQAPHRKLFRTSTLLRPVCDVWDLGPDFDATLGMLGQHTRRNFRREPRFLEAEYGARYVPEVEMTEAEFLELNRDCSHPVSPKLAQARYRLQHEFPNARLAGIQTASGRWLSVAGLHSSGGMTDLYWQMNMTVRGTSLVTAMRSYLLRDELNRGTQFLRFDNGTWHSMRTVFTEQSVSHLLVATRLLPPPLLKRAARALLPPENQLSTVLREPELRWQP